ncbi:RNA 2',3'-cyclic phosphodiesterase [Actinopolymorpha sp. B17G11]|uniref:RNA 2',3'-cyclic phosphodiesterase n=1 Tax=Actinopolymorpha sp. B17G11 TaxID=3160861 RepID=UPI0032E3691F
MRLFVAVVLPEPVLDDLGVAMDHARALAGADTRLRWTIRAQWHLTLAFLGEVDAGVLPELERRLARASARYEPMRLAVEGGGAFGSVRKARVLWAGINGDVERLRQLAGSVSAAARRAGIDVAEGRFRPHVTLARLREPIDVGDQVRWWSTYAGPPWLATRIDLVRSHPEVGAGERPRYESLRAWPLGRPGGAAE